MARTQNGELLDTLQKGFKYIEDGIVRRAPSGACSPRSTSRSDKLGKTYADRNAKLCARSSRKIAKGLTRVLHRQSIRWAMPMNT